MTTEPGEVYLVDLGMAAKVRPMVVIFRKDSDPPRALSVCAPITTSSRESAYEILIGKPRFLRAKSYVNLQGIQAIQHHELHRVIGRLQPKYMDEIRKQLHWVFDLL